MLQSVAGDPLETGSQDGVYSRSFQLIVPYLLYAHCAVSGGGPAGDGAQDGIVAQAAQEEPRGGRCRHARGGRRRLRHRQDDHAALPGRAGAVLRRPTVLPSF